MSDADLASLLEPVEDAPVSVLTRGNLGKLKVAPVSETEPNFNVLIYGHSGVGKTRLAGSAALVPAMCPVLLIDVEGGSFSIRDKYPNVDVVRVQDFKEMQQVYDELEKGTSGYKTVILDSLTEMQKFSMYLIMQDLVKKEADRDPDIPSVREWGKNIEQIRKMVRAFRDLPLNVIFTALVSEERNTRTGLTEKKPYLSGKLAHEVAAFIDIVLYYYTKIVVKDGQQVTKRLLLSSKTEDTVAKDRSDRLPMLLGVEEPPLMQELYDYILGVKAQG
jgi:hypothetical protein